MVEGSSPQDKLELPDLEWDNEKWAIKENLKIFSFREKNGKKKKE